MSIEEEVITTAALRHQMASAIESMKTGKTLEIRRYSETVGFLMPPQRYKKLIELERRYGEDKNEE